MAPGFSVSFFADDYALNKLKNEIETKKMIDIEGKWIILTKNILLMIVE